MLQVGRHSVQHGLQCRNPSVHNVPANGTYVKLLDYCYGVSLLQIEEINGLTASYLERFLQAESDNEER